MNPSGKSTLPGGQLNPTREWVASVLVPIAALKPFHVETGLSLEFHESRNIHE
jgi:hypothetical protein